MGYPMVGRATDLMLVDQAAGPRQAYFSPYQNNGGSVVALAGDDFAVIATDTRLAAGYSILTRDQPKLFKLTDKAILGTGGCWCDILTMTRTMEIRLKVYDQEHHKPMSTNAIAQMVSTMLYHRRFFPYYVSNVVAGLNEEGKGVLYRYDPVGNIEDGTYYSSGAASSLLQPLLDNQVGLKNMEKVTPTPLTLEKAVSLVKDVFISAAEREIMTGDSVIIKIVTSKGVKEEIMGLRRD